MCLVNSLNRECIFHIPTSVAEGKKDCIHLWKSIKIGAKSLIFPIFWLDRPASGEANERHRREPDTGNPVWGCRTRATQQSPHRVGNVKSKNWECQEIRDDFMQPRRVITAFALAMINVAAIASIRNWPAIAEFGFASLFFLIAAALIFFIPAALVAAELTTSFPHAGGIFAWVKEAFGHRTGLLAIWLLWFENVIWYPTALSFLAATLAYMFNPAAGNNIQYMLGTMLVMFCAATFANLKGMRTSSMISTLCVILGTFLPGAIIIFLGVNWLFSEHTLQISMTWDSFFPSLSSPTQFAFFAGVLLSLAGIEMSGVHVKDVANPQRTYPIAILISSILILGLSILGVLAIAVVIPQKEISLVAGTMQAFTYFMNEYGLGKLIPWMALLIVIGAFGSMSTWLVGPARGLLTAAQSGDFPPLFRRVNAKGMPSSLLIFQAIIVTCLCFLFMFMPTVSSAYWILTTLVAQLYLIMYILMFAAVIKLRYKRPKVKRPFKIFGGIAGIWIIGGLGLVSSAATLIIGFFPPSQITTGSPIFYVSFLILGVLIACAIPFILIYFKNPNWTRPLPHERE